VSRRSLWDLLRRQRQAAVLLTTHFMDEADLLSNDIYILDAGAVACHGSSLQLKVQGMRERRALLLTSLLPLQLHSLPRRLFH